MIPIWALNRLGVPNASRTASLRPVFGGFEKIRVFCKRPSLKENGAISCLLHEKMGVGDNLSFDFFKLGFAAHRPILVRPKIF